MKAISLWNPWGILIPIGAKSWETRSWQTAYRGPLVIHIAQRFGPDERALCRQSPFRECLAVAGYHDPADLPWGVFIAIVDLVDIVPTEKIVWDLSPAERAFGNYAPGRFAWKLEQVRPIHPYPFRGQQGLWSLDDALGAVLLGRIKDL